MANAVVAVFDEYNEAQGAVNELLSAGFDRDEIKLSGEEGKEIEAEEVQTEKSSGRGIGGFFRSLFGKEQQDEDVGVYDEALKHGNFVLTAIARTDERSELATEVMSHHHPVDIDARASEWTGKASTGAGARATTTGQGTAIPVVEEEVKVGKREVQRGGVRIFQRVSEKPIEEDVKLREERVTVERTPVNKPASEADLSAFKEGSTEVRATGEEAVVSKAARVVEEVRVGKEVNERTEHIKEKVRRTDVDVENLPEQEYRSHFQQRYGKEGGNYDEYAPYYQYGATAAGSPEFQGRKWNDVEPDLQRDFEARNPESKWERFKDSIRHAFERKK